MTVNTFLYAQLLYEIISLQNIIMSKKRTFTYTHPVCWFCIDTCVLSTNSGSLCEYPAYFERFCFIFVSTFLGIWRLVLQMCVVILFYSVWKIRTKLNNNDSLEIFLQTICKDLEIVNWNITSYLHWPMYLSKHLILNFMEVMQILSILTKQKSR